MPLLLIAIAAMLVQQTMATVAKSAVPVLFKAIADDVGFEPELVLLYTWVFACVGIVVMLGCGAFITRFGPLRVSQSGCVLMGAGLALVAAITPPWWLALGLLAVVGAIVSVGATASTPASSQILAGYAPARWAPLVFSVKQTGVPAGIAIASFAAPLLALAVGWRGASLAIAAGCLLIAIGLQPFRAEFDRDRVRNHPLRLAGLRETFVAVLEQPGLRSLAGCGFAFIGLQSIFTNFTIVYLTETLDYELARAGAALAMAILVAAPGRIVWGWIASSLVPPRTLLAVLAVIMSVATVLMGRFDTDWSHAAIMVPLVLVSATALSWHGVLLSEIARLAPDGQVGRMTGGVLAFGTAGQIVYPGLFWLGHLVGGYSAAYAVVAAPALLAGAAMLRAR